MFKKYFLPVLILLSAFILTSQAGFGFKKEITMLVVPREGKAIQIAQDISRRHPILIVSYQQTKNRLHLDAWNGEGWVEFSEEDYVNGAFFETPPTHTILIESADEPAPDVLIPNGIWCTSGNRLCSTEPHVMIHLLGRYFDFPYLTWKQFSRRYNEPIERINPTLTNLHWWNLYGEDLLDKRDTLDPEQDLDKWLFLDIIPPAPVEPVVIEEEPIEILPAEIPAAKPVPKVVMDEPVADVSVSLEVSSMVATVKSVTKKTSAPETVEEILNSLKPAAHPMMDPFSAEEIPAAKVILQAE